MLAALGVFLSLWLVIACGGLDSLELWAFDLGVRFLHRDSAPPQESAVGPGVTVISFTESYIRQSGEYPIPDSTLAQALENLEALHPAAIGVDIYRDLPVPSRADGATLAGLNQLNKVLADHRNIVMIWKAQENGGEFTPPPPFLLDRVRIAAAGSREQNRWFGQIGFDDLPLDPDSVLRRWLLLIPSSGQTDPRLAPLLAHENLRSLDYTLATIALSAQHLPTQLQEGQGPYLRAPIGGYQVLADFRTRHTVDRFDFQELLTNALPETAVKGGVVLIGGTAPSTGDQKITALGTSEYGVFLHADCVDQLISSAARGLAPLRLWTSGPQAWWLLFWTVAGGVTALPLRGPWQFAMGIVGGVGILLVVFTVELAQGRLLPVVAPTLGWAASAALATAYLSLRERIERTTVTQLFVRNVDRAVFDAIWQQRDELLEEGRIKPRRAVATILFTDLKGFSSASETMTADDLMVWLNEYMADMSSAIIRNNGVILKYIGDSIMAAFGIPLASEDATVQANDAARAIEAALDMRQALAKLNARWKSQGRALAQMRVGIFTGPLVVGSLGSLERMEYTCLGETVNTASRLESYDKSLMDPDIAADGCRILTSQTTQDMVGERFVVRCIGEIEMHNISVKTKAYGVIDRAGRTSTSP
jgi:adenylate cyclase